MAAGESTSRSFQRNLVAAQASFSTAPQRIDVDAPRVPADRRPVGGAPQISILGTRGVPAAHGGFETFVHRFAPYLVDCGFDVTVYCQTDGSGPVTTDFWQGVRRVIISVARGGALGTMIFDWKSTLLASRTDSLILTCGYNTAGLSLLYRLRGRQNIINMDGIEWRRQKYKFHERAFLYLNERLGCLFGNHLIADHPEIDRHLQTRVAADKITMIPYGADEVTSADAELLKPLQLNPYEYAVIIARPEPENSILQMVRAFSSRKRNIKLVVLGKYRREVPYEREVLAAASDEVVFPGAIYEPSVTAALRFYARLYLHGHTIGGTNPSLVEALSAGTPTLAQDNKYNRWVAADGASYFGDEGDCGIKLDQLLDDADYLFELSENARARFRERFTYERILEEYAALVRRFCPVPSATAAATAT